MEKQGKWDISSYFPPISYKFHTFFLHFPLGTFGTFSRFPTSPHLPPPVVWPVDSLDSLWTDSLEV